MSKQLGINTKIIMNNINGVKIIFCLIYLFAFISCTDSNIKYNEKDLLAVKLYKPFNFSKYYNIEKIENLKQLKNIYNSNWTSINSLKHPIIVINKNNEKTNVRNCKEIIKSAKNKIFPEAYPDDAFFDEKCIMCIAAEKIIKIEKAKKSFISNFVLNDEITTMLPMNLALDITDKQSKNKTLKTWHDVDNYTSSKVENNILEMTSEGFISRVSIFASGDFNHDGIEDLLIRIEHYCGRVFRNYLVVITRTEEDGPIKILNVYDSWTQ